MLHGINHTCHALCQMVVFDAQPLVKSVLLPEIF